nr:hypothetical protein [Ectobacillus panaciterrae]
MIKRAILQELGEAKTSRSRLAEEIAGKSLDTFFFISEKQLTLADYLQKEIDHEQHHMKQIEAFSKLRV